MVDGIAVPDRLPVAILCRVGAMFGTGPLAEGLVDTEMFRGDSYRLGSRAIDSLDVVEMVVTLEQEFGVKLLDRVDLEEAGTLRGLAELVAFRADAETVGRFCDRWAAGPADPPGTGLPD